MSNMTTTVPAQATKDDLRIVATTPKIEQAGLIVQVLQWGTMSGADQGPSLLHQFEEPPPLRQLRRRHDPSRAEYRQVMAFLMSCETFGTFVKQGIISEDL